MRAEVTGGKDGNEILPVTYDNNYVTVFPGETVSIHGQFNNSDIAGKPPWIRVEGYNAPKELASNPLRQSRHYLRLLSSIVCFSAPAEKAMVWVSFLTGPRLFPSTRICKPCRRGRSQSATGNPMWKASPPTPGNNADRMPP